MTGAKYAAAVALLLSGATAFAQGNPKFEFAKVEEVKAVEWKAQAKGGVIVTAGNSRTTSATFNANASRKEGNNKLALEGGLAYGRSTILTPTVDTTMTPNVITGLDEASVETTNSWVAKGRYDRFFTANNSGYAAALAAADKIAGKSFYGGGQAGYSRQLVKTDMHLLVAELGYDFSYERYVDQPAKTLAPVSIHSARVFVGEALKLSSATGAAASLEAFFNLNKEGAAIDVNSKMPGVAAFKDTRLTGKISLNTTLFQRLSAGFGITVKYDQNPPPRPVPPGSPAGIGYAPGFQPFADTTDTIAEANLVYTFL